MFVVCRPDTTNEGWNSWPTEKVSHALVRDRRRSERIGAQADSLLREVSADVAALRLAQVIRDVMDEALAHDEADRLRDTLVAFALSRVDWLQLAQAQLEARAPEAVSLAA